MEIKELIEKLELDAKDNTGTTPLFAVPAARLADLCAKATKELGLELALMFAAEEKHDKAYYVHAVLRTHGAVPFVILGAKLPANDPRYPSVTAKVMAAHWYERLIGDQYGIVAENHPDWRRLVHHENVPADTHPLRHTFAWDTKMEHASEPYPMHRVEGKGIFEIPVGPIHAGIIEPGHFRFNVMGERIITLEGKLFFKHKGVEKLLEGKTPEEALPFVERVSGDMAVGHALAFCQAVETATNVKVPERALYLRVVANEIERIIMHLHDISNIGGNGTALSFMFAQGSRLVERWRRLANDIYGHRFLRGVVTVGGVKQDLDVAAQKKILAEAAYVLSELKKLERTARNSDSFMERLETTGVLKTDAARAYGALGLPARASGLKYDVRVDAPYAAYAKLNVKVATAEEGDVAARFFLRFTEIRESVRLITAALEAAPSGAIVAEAAKPHAGHALGAAESWRGEVMDWVNLDKDGKITRCVIRDPSFCNWDLFGELGPGNIVPDFPICNKSLNLSYSGTDL